MARITTADATLVAEKWPSMGATRAGQVVKTYSLGGRTVAVKRGDEVSYVFQDYLNSPALETNAQAAVITRWKYEPHGTTRGNKWPGIEFQSDTVENRLQVGCRPVLTRGMRV